MSVSWQRDGHDGPKPIDTSRRWRGVGFALLFEALGIIAALLIWFGIGAMLATGL